jgi:hypothetical protein
LLFGVVTTLAGLLLVASGVTIRDGTFDTEVIIPGTIAIVGGLLLIGMGLAVRELQRIERALAAKPMPRATRAGETPATDATTNAPDVSVRIPFPPKPKSNPQSVSAGANPAPAPSEDAAVERFRVKFPNLARVESAPVVEEDALHTSVSGLGAREVAMSIDFPRQRGAVIANIGTKGSALQRYKSERDAAMAWVKHLQVSGGATKEEWLEFSERIRFAAERLLKESANEPTSIAI